MVADDPTGREEPPFLLRRQSGRVRDVHRDRLVRVDADRVWALERRTRRDRDRMRGRRNALHRRRMERVDASLEGKRRRAPELTQAVGHRVDGDQLRMNQTWYLDHNGAVARVDHSMP